MSRYAFVFPGQGSQRPGMLEAWIGRHACVAETLEEANDTLGFDLAGMLRNGPDAELNQTANTQPAMLVADVAIWRAWQAAGGPDPVVMAGHSLGEYAALVAAEAMAFPAALKLVRARGQWMQEAVPAGQGGMAAVIGLEDAQVIALCREQAAGQVLEAVNFNAPGQVVVAGHAEAIDRLLANAKAAGARLVTRLPVSVPAHSRLMAPVSESLAAACAEVRWQPPRLPVLHNLDARAAPDTSSLVHALAQQVRAPVQWVATLRRMAEEYAIEAGFECGPGQVLVGLAKRTLKPVPFTSLAEPDKLEAALQLGEKDHG